MLRLVSNNDDSALLRREAFVDLHWNAKATIPNLLAVMRGGGDAKDLIQQLLELADSIEAAAKVSTDPVMHEDLQEVMISGFKEGCARNDEGCVEQRVRAASASR